MLHDAGDAPFLPDDIEGEDAGENGGADEDVGPTKGFDKPHERCDEQQRPCNQDRDESERNEKLFPVRVCTSLCFGFFG